MLKYSKAERRKLQVSVVEDDAAYMVQEIKQLLRKVIKTCLQ